MANVRKTKKINETISNYKIMIRNEKVATVNALTKNSKLTDKIVGWMDYHKTIEKNCVILMTEQIIVGTLHGRQLCHPMLRRLVSRILSRPLAKKEQIVFTNKLTGERNYE